MVSNIFSLNNLTFLENTVLVIIALVILIITLRAYTRFTRGEFKNMMKFMFMVFFFLFVFVLIRETSNLFLGVIGKIVLGIELALLILLCIFAFKLSYTVDKFSDVYGFMSTDLRTSLKKKWSSG